MLRGIIETPIFVLFGVTGPLFFLQWYGLDVWTVAGSLPFIGGAVLVMSALIGLRVAQMISGKLLGPEPEGIGDTVEKYDSETLAEKRP